MKHTSVRAALFAAALCLCAAVFTGCGAKNVYTAGTYTGSGDGFKGPIHVSVQVSSSEIEAVTVTEISDSDFTQSAVDTIISKMVSSNSADVDTVSGATYTSKGLIAAVQAALVTAKGTKGADAKNAVSAAKDESCDVVIIGAGGAGLSAAVEAANAGARVIVLEKMPIVGGNTNYATGGLNASETSVQAAKGIADTNESFYDDTMKGGKNINDSTLVTYMVENSASAVDWLVSLGADLSDVGKMAGSTNSRTHRPTGGAAVGGHLVEVLYKAVQDAGVDIRLRNTVTGIVAKTENGVPSAAGVTVSSPSGDYTISAKAVIIATGGFGASPEKIVAYKPSLAGFGTTNHAGATGDAIDLVVPFSAAFTDMQEIQTHPTVVPVKNTMITEAVRGNGAILINREGKRFISELETRDVVSDAMLAQTGKTAYLVFDQSVRESLSAIESYVKEGILTQADTPQALTSALGIDPGIFAASMAAYNEAVASGKDADFGRSDMPRQLAKGPYYAVEVGPAVHHTMGGLKINVNTEVLNTDGSVIPGLYAAGEVTGGVHGANRLGGNAVADIAIFGRAAGAQAARYAGQ